MTIISRYMQYINNFILFHETDITINRTTEPNYNLVESLLGLANIDEISYCIDDEFEANGQ